MGVWRNGKNASKADIDTLAELNANFADGTVLDTSTATRPANGGNADTVDGSHAAAFEAAGAAAAHGGLTSGTHGITAPGAALTTANTVAEQLSALGAPSNTTTRSRGGSYQTAAGSRVCAVAGTWYDWNGTFAAGTLQGFTESGGVLTYTGAAQKVFAVSYCGLHRSGGTGSGGTVKMGISISGATPLAEHVRSSRVASAASSHGFCVPVTLTTGQTIKVQVEAPAGADGTTTYYWDLVSGLSVME